MKRPERIKLSSEQRLALEELWFVYGNGGKKHSMPNHKYVQNILEQGRDYRNFYGPDAELVEKVDAILDVQN